MNVILVNSQDEPIGTAEKMEAHRQGWLHRAFSIFIVNDQGQLLLQQRHPDKYHCGGLWTNSCCSHPHPGETTPVAAERRLYEELGIKVSLQYSGHFTYRAEFANGLIEHEYDHVFWGEYSGQVKDFDPCEIAAVKWLTVEEIHIWLRQAPQDFTPWFEQALAMVEKQVKL